MGPLRSKKLTEREEEVKEEYLKTLQDLTFNSKLLINVLTEVAAENKDYAACIVECIEEQLNNVPGPLKLPILYLVDSIIKCESIKQYYLPMFCRKIHILFMKVYQSSDENIRSKLAKLRFTWNGVLPPETLAALDNAVRSMTLSWQAPPAVHVNPKFVKAGVTAANLVAKANPSVSEPVKSAVKPKPSVDKEELRQKRQMLLELTKRNQELQKELTKRNQELQKELKVLQSTEAEMPTAEAPTTALINARSNLAPSRTASKLSPNQYALVNGAQQQAPQTGPAFRIAPVNSLLINAAVKRARDPRLQKVPNEPTPPAKKLPTTSEPVTALNGRREAAAPTPRIVIAPKCDKRNESPEKPTPTDAAPLTLKKTEPSAKSRTVAAKESSSIAPTPATEDLPSPVKKRKIEKSSKEKSPPRASNSGKKEDTRKRKVSSGKRDDRHESESPSPEKRKSNGDSASKSKSSNSRRKATSTIDDLFEDPPKKREKQTVKSFSKEEREKRIRMLMDSQNPETERLLQSLTEKSPRIAEKFIRVLKKGKETPKTSPIVDVDSDSSEKSDVKSPSPVNEPEELDNVDVDCVIVSSPKPAVEPLKSPPPPPQSDATEEYDPIADLPEPEESHAIEASPKVEPVASPPPSQDVDLRSLIAPASVIVPPVVTASKSPPTAPPPPPPIFPFMVPGMEFGFPGMVTPPIIVPNASADVLVVIDRDPLSTISIDGIPREIRHYGSTAVVLMNWDDPRKISFSSDDSPRRIVVDDKYTVECMLNAPDVERMIYGKSHRFRLGVPTRELYVDGVGYECFFGGPPIENVRLGERTCFVRLKGKPPKVDIGVKRQDLVAGKVTLYLNDKHTFHLFLDAKAQKVEVDGCKFVFMFIDSLQRILINEVPFRADFGGISYPFMHQNKLFYFRLALLPMGVIPGAVQIYQMMTSKLPEPPPLPPSLRYTAGEEFPLLPVPPMMSNVPMMPVASLPTPIIMNTAEPSIATTLAATEPSTSSAVKNEESSADSLTIDELVQKLLAEGLVSLPEVTSTTSVGEQSPSKPSSSRSRKSRKETNPPKVEPVKFVDLDNPDTFKQKQPGMVSLLYTGTQCGSCGLRFPEEQTLKYSEHLDWHFRLNRRGKDGARTIHSRKWYYKATSWLQFQEMEDESDRGTSWFDNHPPTEYTEEVIEEVPCIRASSDLPEECELCQDRFEQFYNQDLEEWQMRNAVNVGNKVYHPICLKDHKEEDNQSDVEEIVDTTEPISLTEDEPSVVEDDLVSVGGIAISDTCLPDISSIKREKEDKAAATTLASVDKPTETTEGVETDGQSNDINKENDDDDSDVEEVQLIEEPIEEIIIPDDGNDLEEDSNLETLHIEEIITPSELESRPDTVPDEVVEDPADRIVDITQSASVVSIDGNVEPGESMPPMVLKPTVIKFNIAREKSNSPAEAARSPPKNDETLKTKRVEDFSRINCENEEPPPPGEETTTVTLAPASVKPRIRERKLTEYPPVKKGSGDSGLCSIM